MRTVIIYGASDDLLCVTGDGFNDEFYPKNDDEREDFLALSDGTLLRVKYDGCWRLQRLFSGTAEFAKVEATGDDGPDHPGGQPRYSDLVTLRGDIKWAALATHYTKATPPGPPDPPKGAYNRGWVA